MSGEPSNRGRGQAALGRGGQGNAGRGQGNRGRDNEPREIPRGAILTPRADAQARDAADVAEQLSAQSGERPTGISLMARRGSITHYINGPTVVSTNGQPASVYAVIKGEGGASGKHELYTPSAAAFRTSDNGRSVTLAGSTSGTPHDVRRPNRAAPPSEEREK